MNNLRIHGSMKTMRSYLTNFDVNWPCSILSKLKLYNHDEITCFLEMNIYFRYEVYKYTMSCYYNIYIVCTYKYMYLL